MTVKRLGLGTRLAALSAASFAGIGVYMPFFPLWLEHRALTPSEIGFVLAVPIVVRIVATAPLMAWVDRGAGVRRLMIFAHLGLVAIYAALGWAEGVPAIALLVALMAVAQAPVIPTADLVVMDAVRDRSGLDYGRIRLWGSIAFLAASLAGGSLLGALDPDMVIGVLAALAAAGVAVSFVAVPVRIGSGNPARASIAPGAGRQRFPVSLRYVVASAALIQASHAAVYAFGSIHWRDAGVSSPTIGALWAIGIVAEIVVFACFGRVVGQRQAAFRLLAIGGGAAALRFAAMAFEPGLLATFALQSLHGLSFGMTHLGTIAALAWLAPETGRARAQGVLGAVLATATATATALSGLIFRDAGTWVFPAMAPLALAGLACALLASRAAARHPHKAGEGG